MKYLKKISEKKYFLYIITALCFWFISFFIPLLFSILMFQIIFRIFIFSFWISDIIFSLTSLFHFEFFTCFGVFPLIKSWNQNLKKQSYHNFRKKFRKRSEKVTFQKSLLKSKKHSLSKFFTKIWIINMSKYHIFLREHEYRTGLVRDQLKSSWNNE